MNNRFSFLYKVLLGDEVFLKKKAIKIFSEKYKAKYKFLNDICRLLVFSKVSVKEKP